MSCEMVRPWEGGPSFSLVFRVACKATVCGNSVHVCSFHRRGRLPICVFIYGS